MNHLVPHASAPALVANALVRAASPLVAPLNLTALWNRDQRERPAPTATLYRAVTAGSGSTFESDPASVPAPTHYRTLTVREGTLKETWKPN